MRPQRSFRIHTLAISLLLNQTVVFTGRASDVESDFSPGKAVAPADCPAWYYKGERVIPPSGGKISEFTAPSCFQNHSYTSITINSDTIRVIADNICDFKFDSHIQGRGSLFKQEKCVSSPFNLSEDLDLDLVSSAYLSSKTVPTVGINDLMQIGRLVSTFSGLNKDQVRNVSGGDMSCLLGSVLIDDPSYERSSEFMSLGLSRESILKDMNAPDLLRKCRGKRDVIRRAEIEIINRFFSSAWQAVHVPSTEPAVTNTMAGLSASDSLRNEYINYRNTYYDKMSPDNKCLHSIILQEFPDYAKSDEYRSYTDGMSEDDKAKSYRYGIVFCPSDQTEVKKLASNIINSSKTLWSTTSAMRIAQASKDQPTPPADPDPEMKELPLTCNNSNMPKNEFIIGRVPKIPTGAEVIVGAASAALSSSTVSPIEDDDSTLTIILKRSREAAASKASFSAEIANARQRFFDSRVGSQARAEAGVEFGNLLFAKDIYYLSLYLPEGTTLQAQKRVDALMLLTGASVLDGGLGASFSDFGNWVDAVRQALHAPNGGLIQIPTPSEYTAALKAAMPAYLHYKAKRDKQEFLAWDDSHGQTMRTKSVLGRLNRYFSLVIDPAINVIYCSSDNEIKSQIISDRKQVRYSLYTYDHLNIDPSIVLSTIDWMNRNNSNDKIKRDEIAFEDALARRQRGGENNIRMLSLLAMQDVFLGRGKDSSRIPLNTLEIDVRMHASKDTQGLSDERFISKYGLHIPPYFAVQGDLESGRYEKR